MPPKNDQNRSKRASNRSPSPQHRATRRRVESRNPTSGIRDGDPEGVKNSVPLDDFIGKLKPLNGPAPLCVTGWFTDHENGRIYAVDSRKDINCSLLFVLQTSNMRWAHVPVVQHAPNTFLDAQKDLPFLCGPALELWGPVNHRRLLLFGGDDVDGNPTNDLLCIDLQAMSWSQVLIEGGTVTPGELSTIALIDTNKLCVFGVVPREEVQNNFSLAEFNPSTGVWRWQRREQPLPDALMTSSIISLVPLYDRRKILLVGWSENEKGSKDVEADHIFIFDTYTQTFARENHASGEFPHSMHEIAVNAVSNRNDSIFQACTPAGDDVIEHTWVYSAFPLKRWRRLARIGPLKDLSIVWLVVLGGKILAFVKDERLGDYGLNKYVELDELIQKTEEA